MAVSEQTFLTSGTDDVEHRRSRRRKKGGGRRKGSISFTRRAHIHIHTDTHRDRHTHTQTDRQTHTHTRRQTDRHTHTHADAYSLLDQSRAIAHRSAAFGKPWPRVKCGQSAMLPTHFLHQIQTRKSNNDGAGFAWLVQCVCVVCVFSMEAAHSFQVTGLSSLCCCLIELDRNGDALYTFVYPKLDTATREYVDSKLKWNHNSSEPLLVWGRAAAGFVYIVHSPPLEQKVIESVCVCVCVSVHVWACACGRAWLCVCACISVCAGATSCFPFAL